MLSDIESASLEFGLKLDKILSSKDKNLVFSPFSLSTALAMTLLGTRNKSGEELSSVLFGRTIKAEEHKALAQNYRTIVEKCLESNAQVLSSANFLYAHSKYRILDAFKRLIESSFGAKAREVDFETKNKEAIDAINSDISAATKGKIPNLFQQLDINTKLVLANALYFKGLWRSKFKTENTKDAKFKTNDKKEVDVKMMFQKTKLPFGYSEQLKCSAVELAYDKSNSALVILLPDEESSVAELKAKLTATTLKPLLSSLSSLKVELWLPRFKIESTLPLIPALTKAGITKIFDPNSADFSGITDHPLGLYVGDVIQKAVIEVNEEGTEAAAATGVAFMARSLEIPERMEFNRPFVFFLVSKFQDKRIILFSGTVNNPSEETVI